VDLIDHTLCHFRRLLGHLPQVDALAVSVQYDFNPPTLSPVLVLIFRKLDMIFSPIGV
jgi:hypothetical protein